jgi:hypothetical protein
VVITRVAVEVIYFLVLIRQVVAVVLVTVEDGIQMLLQLQELLILVLAQAVETLQEVVVLD